MCPDEPNDVGIAPVASRGIHLNPGGSGPRRGEDLRAIPARDPSPAAERVVELACADMIVKWRQGLRATAESYMTLHPALGGGETGGFELIYGEYAVRVNLGERPSLDEFDWRFPLQAARLRSQVALDRALEAMAVVEPLESTLMGPPPEASRRPPGEGDHPERLDRRLAELHGPGAGRGPQPRGRTGGRLPRAGGDPLRIGDRKVAVPGGDDPPDVGVGPEHRPDPALAPGADRGPRRGDHLPEMPGQGAGPALFRRRGAGRGPGPVRRRPADPIASRASSGSGATPSARGHRPSGSRPG